MEFRRASTDEIQENAYVNNTFSLPLTEKVLKSAVENSFNYLQRLQKSYIDISRFTYTTDDLYVDSDYKVCLTINKGFIDAVNRYAYRTSDLYGKWLTLDELNANSHLFSYIPIITIDNQSIFSYKVKCELDGKTHIMFTHVDNYQTFIGDKEVEDLPSYIEHHIEVTVLRATKFEHIVASGLLLEDGTIDYSNFEYVTDDSTSILVYFQFEDEDYGSQVFVPSFGEDGIVLDIYNPAIQNIFNGENKVTMYVYKPTGLKSAGDPKVIYSRVDNFKKSCIAIAQPEELGTYQMSIPVENIMVIVCDNVTGEEHLELNREVTLHYPNIYEIDCSDLTPVKNTVKVLYFYKELQDMLHYNNRFNYIHKYYTRKLDEPLETAICKLLYTHDVDSDLQTFFLSLFRYEDPDYIYDMGDFFDTLKPYDFDYKITKMKEFIKNDTDLLVDYAKKVSVITQVYNLDVRNIDLNKRIRYNTYNETDDPAQRVEFEEPAYVFAFRNETGNTLDLRIFVDGLLFTTLVHVVTDYMDYIYIPQSKVTPTTFIEIEKFNSYKYQKEVILQNEFDAAYLDFPQSPLSTPTLFDLYVTDAHGNPYPRRKFKIYAVVDPREYNISDDTNEREHAEIFTVGDLPTTDNDDPTIPGYDPEVDILIDLSDATVDDEGVEPPVDYNVTVGQSIAYTPDPTIRLPVEYYKIKRLKITTSYADCQGVKFIWHIDKVPYLCNTVMKSNGSPIGRLPSTAFKWKEDASYVRYFHNGRFIPTDFIYVDNDPTQPNYFITNKFARAGDVVVFDISPYSYVREFTVEEVPEDFVINIDSALSKPFDTAYYDVYLNGRKLSDNNFQMIGSYQLRLINVHSRKHLYFYRKDRDYEYYNMSGNTLIPLDKLLASELISDEDKAEIIDGIIRDAHSSYAPGEDVEPDAENEDAQGSAIERAIMGLYYDVIIPLGVVQPESDTINKEQVEFLYADAVERYAGENNRIVIRPNNNYSAEQVLLVGRNFDINS